MGGIEIPATEVCAELGHDPQVAPTAVGGQPSGERLNQRLDERGSVVVIQRSPHLTPVLVDGLTVLSQDGVEHPAAGSEVIGDRRAVLLPGGGHDVLNPHLPDALLCEQALGFGDQPGSGFGGVAGHSRCSSGRSGYLPWPRGNMAVSGMSSTSMPSGSGNSKSGYRRWAVAR